jgi:hypothetical protein
MDLIPGLTRMGVLVAGCLILFCIIVAVAIAYKNRDNY